MKRLTLKIHGQVQGVFFRAVTQEKARELGLTGWVKNAPDGTVEVVAEGEESDLRKLEEFCQKGPSYSVVTELEKGSEEIDKVSFDGFTIRY
jgi:acylphosphatase